MYIGIGFDALELQFVKVYSYSCVLDTRVRILIFEEPLNEGGLSVVHPEGTFLRRTF